jgi:hypothetical protein
MVLTHVVVGNVDIRVANAAILQLKGHIIVPRHVPFDGDGGKGGALGCPSPGLGLIQLTSHLDRSSTAVTEMGAKGAPLAALAQALVSYSSPAI